MRFVFFTIALGLAQASFADSIAVPKLVERAAQSGIDHRYTGPFEFYVGGGAAAFDCNKDRLPDLMLAGGSGAAQFYLNTSKAGGDLTFEPRDMAPNVDLSQVFGAYPIDLDNDGFLDLVVLRNGENYLLKGHADCRFQKANAAFGFDGGDLASLGFSAIFEPGQTHPTLAIGNYIDHKAEGTPFGTCSENVLYRPQTGDAIYGKRTSLTPGFCSLSLAFTDWNGTGEFDLRITNDRQYYRGGEEQMWSLNHGAEPRLFTAADGWKKLKIWGMGIAQGDINSDGKPEYVLTSMADNMLQIQNADGKPQYMDVAFAAGTTAHRPYVGSRVKPSTGWHAEFADFNNDAWADLFIAKGNVERMVKYADFDPDNLLLRTPDGTFKEHGEAAGLALARRGRGAVVEDFNVDGVLDLLVVNREEEVSLFQGANTEIGNFLAIELDNGPVNPDGIGAMVSITTGARKQLQTVQIGGGHASGHLGYLHFGLGASEHATIQVKWPGIGWGKPVDVDANAFITLRREPETVAVWRPTRQ